jgi:hypothetical protein
VSGDIFGDTIDVEEVKISGSTVIDDTGEWMGLGSTVPCPGCVGSSDIADGSIASSDLGSGSVTGTKIASGAVGASAIRSNAVTNIHLADDAVTGAEILDGSITAADVVGGGLYSAKTQLYAREVDQAFPAVQGVLDVSAMCDDANDLALNGSCHSVNTSGIELYSTADSHWTDPTQPAEWTCWFYNRLAVSSTITARILCVSVP